MINSAIARLTSVKIEASLNEIFDIAKSTSAVKRGEIYGGDSLKILFKGGPAPTYDTFVFIHKTGTGYEIEPNARDAKLGIDSVFFKSPKDFLKTLRSTYPKIKV